MTWAGPLPTSKSGDSPYWSTYFTMQPPCRRKSIRGTPKDSILRKPKRWPLNTPLWGLSKEPLMMPLSKWPNRFIEGSGPWLPVCFPIIRTMTAWGNYDRIWADIWLGQACRVQQVWGDPQGIKDAPGATQLCNLTCPLQIHKQGRLPNGQRKTLWQDDLNHGNDVPD